MAVSMDWRAIWARLLQSMSNPFLCLCLNTYIEESQLTTGFLSSYPGVPVWVTEYALDNDTLTNTQSFFNQTAEYFDSLNQTTRYSYFGAFRSDVSNVGPNAAMLTQNGKLTDIGSWYLGGAATNNIPSLTGAAPREIVNFGIVAALAAFAGFLVL